MTAMEKNNKTLNVPHLRFPEFTGEWESIHLGEISDVTKLAGFEFTEYVRYEDEGEIIALRGLNCKNGSLDLNDVKYIDNSVLEKLIRSKLCIGDILFTYVGTVGEVAIIEENDRFYLAPNVSRIRLRDKYNPYFIKHQLYNKRFYNKVVFPLIATSSQPALSMENVRRFKLNIPTISEQDKIAKFLNLLDLRISTQRKIIEKHESLIRGLYHFVFNQPAVALQLNDVVSVVKGKQVNGEDLLEDGKYYMMNGGTEPSGYLDEYNTPANTISISEGGNSCGYVQYNTEPFWSGGHCYSLIQKEVNINYQYLYHFLKYKERDIMALRIGSGLPNVQKKDLERFEIRLLPIEQQNRVAEILEGLSAKCGLEKRVLQRWQSQKSFLLRNLFI